MLSSKSGDANISVGLKAHRRSWKGGCTVVMVVRLYLHLPSYAEFANPEL